MTRCRPNSSVLERAFTDGDPVEQRLPERRVRARVQVAGGYSFVTVKPASAPLSTAVRLGL